MKERDFFKLTTAMQYGEAAEGFKWVSAHRERAGTCKIKNGGMTATKPHLSVYKTDSSHECFTKIKRKELNYAKS